MRRRPATWFLAVMLAAGVAAQTSTPPSASPKPAAEPAIVLLLRAPRTLDADAFRQRFARIVKGEVASAPTTTGAWVAADGEHLRGGRDGVNWQVRREDKQAIAEVALQHLGEMARERMAAHGARLVVRTEAVADAAAEAAAYRVLGSVAAALLANDVSGIGAARHGGFVRYVRGAGGTRKGLLDDDPARALAPTASTSLVVFLRAARRFDEAAIAKAMSDEFRVEITAAPTLGTNKVEVDGQWCRVSIGGESVFLTMRDAMPAADADANRELRARTALAEHKAMLHVEVSGVVDEVAEAARRRLVARVVAALWGDDVLMVNWHCDARLIPVGEDLRAQLRSDDPVAASLGSPVVPILLPSDEAAMDKAIADARANWATAAEHLSTGGELSAKFPFAARKGGHEHIWITVQKIDGDTVHGVIGNEPFDVEGIKLGSTVACKLSELSDWLFLKKGKMVGGYTVRVLQEQQRRKAGK